MVTCSECPATVPAQVHCGKQILTCSVTCKRARANRIRNARCRKPSARVRCTWCDEAFDRVPARGGQPICCSSACTSARNSWRRHSLRQERYQALVAAGAHSAVAADGSEGPTAFRAAMRMLEECPSEFKRKPKAKAAPRPAPRAPRPALLDLLRSRYPNKQHPWANRARAEVAP